MPIRRMGGGGGGRGGGGSIELASAYVAIMPETGKVAPGVRRVAQQAGQALNQEISGAMRTAFQRAETYATPFGQAIARQNLAATSSYNALIDKTEQYRASQDNLTRVMNNKKSTAEDVAQAVQYADRMERQWMQAQERHGANLANYNAAQQKFITDQQTGAQKRAAAQQREFASQNAAWQRNLKATQNYLQGHQKFIDDTAARAKKLFDPPSPTNLGNAFKRAQTAMRNELDYTAQQGATAWQRMSARMALANMGVGNNLRGSVGSALDEIQNRASRTFEGVRRGMLDAFGAPLGVRATAAGAGLLGGYAVFSGVDRVLSGGFQRLQTIQNAQVAMTAIMGDQKKAMELVKQVSDLAVGTPFGADTFLNAARNLTTMGVNTDQVVPSIKALGDALSIMGRGPEALDQITREFGKIKAEGRIMGRDVYELQRVGGINARTIIANALGMTGHELTKQMGEKGGLDVDADRIIQLLIEGIEHGSTGVAGTTVGYEGGMEKIRQTVTGSLMVLKSQADRIGAAFLTPFFDRMPGAVDKMTDKFRDMANENGPIAQFAKRLSDLGGGAIFEKMFTSLPGILSGVMNLGNRAMDALQSPGAQRAIGIIKQDLTGIWNVAKETWPVFQRLGGTLASSFGGVAVAGLTLLKDTLTLLAPPLRVVTGFFADNKAITGTLIGLWAALALKSKVVEMAMGPLGRVMGAFNRQVYDMNTNTIRNETMWNRMGTAFRNTSSAGETLGGTLKGSLKAGMSGLKEIGGGLLGVFGGPWGLLATAAIGGITYALSKNAEAHQQAAEAAEKQRAAEEALQGQLDQTTGAMTEEARAAVAKSLQDSGALDAAKRVGLDPHQALLAATGDEASRHAIDQQLADLYKSTPSLRPDIEKVAREIDGQINLWQGAMQKIEGVNEALHGTHQLTEQGAEALRQWGADIDSIPSDKTIVVKAETDQAKANVKALQDQGFTVEQDLNDPNKFRITANTDEAIQKLQSFLVQVDTATPQVHIGATTDPAQNVLNDFIAQVQGRPPVNIPFNILPPGSDPFAIPNGPGTPGPTPPGFPVPRVATMPPPPPPPPHRASGGRLDSMGMLYGRGNGRSDSIYGLVDGSSPVQLSHLESVNNRKSTMQNWSWIDAMNKGLNLTRLFGAPGYDDGGLLRGWWRRPRVFGPPLPAPAPPPAPAGPPISGPGLNPLLAPSIIADPSIVQRQQQKVAAANAALAPAESAANQRAAAAYTGVGGQGDFNPLAQGVFAGRRAWEQSASVLASMDQTAAALGTATAPLGRIPENFWTQSFPDPGTVIGNSFDALSAGSFGLIPNLPRAWNTLGDPSAGGLATTGALLTLASVVPIPGMGEASEAFGAGVRAAGRLGANAAESAASRVIIPEALRSMVARPTFAGGGVHDVLTNAWMRIGTFNAAKPWIRQGGVDAVRRGFGGIDEMRSDVLVERLMDWNDTNPIGKDEADMLNRLMARAGHVNFKPIEPTEGGVPFEVKEMLRSLGREALSMAIHSDPTAQSVWRGMKLTPEELASIQAGQTMSFPLSSFTRHRDMAAEFATDIHGWQEHPENWVPVLYRIQKGAHLTDLSHTDMFGSHYDELLGQGNFLVRGIRSPRNGSPAEVVLRQLGLDPENFNLPLHLQTPYWERDVPGRARGGRFSTGGWVGSGYVHHGGIDPRDYGSRQEYLQAVNLASILGYINSGGKYSTGGLFPRRPMFSPGPGGGDTSWWGGPGYYHQDAQGHSRSRLNWLGWFGDALGHGQLRGHYAGGGIMLGNVAPGGDLSGGDINRFPKRHGALWDFMPGDPLPRAAGPNDPILPYIPPKGVLPPNLWGEYGPGEWNPSDPNFPKPRSPREIFRHNRRGVGALGWWGFSGGGFIPLRDPRGYDPRGGKTGGSAAPFAPWWDMDWMPPEHPERVGDSLPGVEGKWWHRGPTGKNKMTPGGSWAPPSGSHPPFRPWLPGDPWKPPVQFGPPPKMWGYRGGGMFPLDQQGSHGPHDLEPWEVMSPWGPIPGPVGWLLSRYPRPVSITNAKGGRFANGGFPMADISGTPGRAGGWTDDLRGKRVGGGRAYPPPWWPFGVPGVKAPSNTSVPWWMFPGGTPPGFANGARTIRGPGTGTSDSIPGLVDGINPILVSNGESINTARSTAANWPVIDAMNKGLNIAQILRKVGVSRFEGGGLTAAYQTGYAMNGKPYANTFGDAAADCSGFVSMIVNAATGLGVGGARMTTQTAAEWLQAHGAVIGTPPGPGFLTVGWYNHGPGVQDGHMAGTMPDGTNFEAGGGPNSNVKFGGDATGAMASEFDQHAWFPYTALFPDGSVTVPPGSPPTTPYGGAGGGGASMYSMGGGNMTAKQYQSLQHQVQEAGDKVVSTQHDIEIAQQHIDDLNAAKTPPKEATMMRAQETLRRAQDAHQEALTKQSQLQGQLQTASVGGGGGAGGKGVGPDGKDLGQAIVSGMFESLGIDGSVFSDPRQWTGVKSMIALLNWFTKPLGSDTAGAGLMQMSQGGLPPGYQYQPGLESATDQRGQMADAIARAGMAAGANPNVMQSAYMAALQESNLNPLAENAGHSGLFQMDAAKGTLEQRQDPNFAANWFFSQAMGIPGAENMDPGQLAEAVEKSGHGERYGPHAKEAQDLMNAALGRFQGTQHGAATQFGPGPGNVGGEPQINPAAFMSAAGGGGDGGGGIIQGMLSTLFPNLNFGAQIGGPNGLLGQSGIIIPGLNAPMQQQAPGFTPPELAPFGAPGPQDIAPPPPQFPTDTSAVNDGGLTPGGGPMNVGNVSFHLGPGATLGWDPDKVMSVGKREANMAVNKAAPSRTIQL